MFGNRELLEKSTRLATLWFRSYIKLVELLYTSIEAGPGISIANKFQCFVLTKVASKNVIMINVIMIILENIYVKITNR